MAEQQQQRRQQQQERLAPASLGGRRIRHELDDLQPEEGNADADADADAAQPDRVTAVLVDDAIDHLRATITGPPDTPYAGARFELDVRVPANYPFAPPKVRFITSLWHPNVSSATGHICLDVLATRWSAALSVRTVLLSIQAMMAAPNPEDPQDAVAAAMMIKTPTVHTDTARYWAHVFAGAPADVVNADQRAMLEQAVAATHCTEAEALKSLSNAGWQLAAAVADLKGTGRAGGGSGPAAPASRSEAQ